MNEITNDAVKAIISKHPHITTGKIVDKLCKDEMLDKSPYMNILVGECLKHLIASGEIIAFKDDFCKKSPKTYTILLSKQTGVSAKGNA